MTKQEFYEKYNKILTQHSVDTLSLYHKVLSIIQADNFMDEEQGNSKPLNIDDFAYTLNSDMQLKNIFRTSTLKVNMQVSKAKEMYEIQLYRLLLDALLLTMGKDVPKECGLLSPSALKTAEILKLNITRGGNAYATESDCETILNKLSELSQRDTDATDKFYEFLEFLKTIYQENATLFNIICVEILDKYKDLPIATSFYKLSAGENSLFDKKMNEIFTFDQDRNIDDSVFDALVLIANKWVKYKKDIFPIES
ncbi:MAG: hypothetical protein IKP66_07795 [Lachnospiraceae bacterium]|nr:hypothetical protein [Lachnospiraceae bacterium]